MTRVLIVDDQALFREGLRTVLSVQGIDVVGEAANGDDAVKLAERLAPDVVLMDLRMPVLDGVDATRRIAKLPHAPRIIAHHAATWRGFGRIELIDSAAIRFGAE